MVKRYDVSILKAIWDVLFSKRKPKPTPPITGVSNGPGIAIINAGTVLKDSDITPVVQALQIQVNRDFASLWGKGASVIQVPKGSKPPEGTWWMVLLDNSDQAGALGYHDLSAEGLPIGKCFAKTCMDAGDPWSTCLGHETLEALGDPYINKMASDFNGINYAYENCDAVEAQTYLINNVPMTNFQTELWFDLAAPAGSKLDFLGSTTKPFQLAAGGYTSVQDPNNGPGWGIITADRSTKTLWGSRAPVGSRRDRRRTPRELWVRSNPNF